MKILHINGTCHGGAANVAERIHQSLLDKKVESYIYLPFKKDLNVNSPGSASLTPLSRAA